MSLAYFVSHFVFSYVLYMYFVVYLQSINNIYITIYAQANRRDVNHIVQKLRFMYTNIKQSIDLQVLLAGAVITMKRQPGDLTYNLLPAFFQIKTLHFSKAWA